MGERRLPEEHALGKGRDRGGWEAGNGLIIAVILHVGAAS